MFRPSLPLSVWTCALCVACATAHADVRATTPVHAVTASSAGDLAPRAVTPPVAQAVHGAPDPRTRGRNYTIDIDSPPPAFYALTASERERWYVCHVLFLTPGEGAARDGAGNGTGEVRRMAGQSLPQPARLHLAFTAHVGDYVAQPDARARRDFLVRNGCPASLVDLSDGTHVDLVEGADDASAHTPGAP